jgi:HmuY protein
MRFWLALLVAVSAGPIAGCSSTPLDDTNDEAAAGGADGSPGSDGGAGGGDSSPKPEPNPCQGALRQSLGLVDELSGGAVATLEADETEAKIFVDASAGGVDGQDRFPWVYLSLERGAAAALTDLEALESTEWDLAFKRFVVRTNGGDSGPGRGGALRVALTWDDVDQSTLGDVVLPQESWFDDECNLTTDENGELITTFSGWSQYDQAAHVLTPANVVFITAAADGSLYKVAIEDYYATPSGQPGNVAGRYLLRVAPLP